MNDIIEYIKTYRMVKSPKKLECFIREHPSKGREKQFDGLLNRMANSKKKPAK